MSIMSRGLGTRVCAVALAVVFAAAWAAAARADAITDANVVDAVAAAKTPADHQALYAYFMSKAEAAKSQVEMHQRMAAAFSGKMRENLKTHCDALIGTYKKQAKDYTALAKEQQQLAGGK